MIKLYLITKAIIKYIKKTIREAKKLANDQYIKTATNKSKASWMIVHKELGFTKCKYTKIEYVIDKHKTVKTDLQIPECLNDYFVNVAFEYNSNSSESEAIKNLNNIRSLQNVDHLTNFKPVTISEVKRVILNMKPK
jgi:hypothetical protein